MALLVLLTLGSAIGWMAAVLLKQDSVRQSVSHILIGAIGALLGQALASGGIPSDSIEPGSLLIGGIGSALSLALATFLRIHASG